MGLEQTQGAAARERIARLRQVMRERDVAAVWVPSSDPHLSEYVPDRWKAREWVSGFTGSMGTLVVTAEDAGLWVDSRYWEQADAQLKGSGIATVRTSNAPGQPHLEWLAANVPPGRAVAVDGAVLGLGQARSAASLLTAKGVVLRTDLDVVAEAWPDRPRMPFAPVYAHEQAAGSRADKLQALRAELARVGATHHFISTLDDIAWLTNLRGADVDYNPVFLAHLLVEPGGARLFITEGKVPDALRVALEADGITLRPYDEAARALGALPADAKLLVDPRRVTHGLRQAVAEGVAVVEALNPSTVAKSRKTAAELEHIRGAMAQDGAALCHFFAWFESALGREPITELTIDERLSAERARRPGFVSLSFATIAAFNANGAMPHYRATPESHATVCTPGQPVQGLLLIDSGGQYTTGTTDITRVVPVGEPTAEQRRDFTLVLQGMIHLSQAHFPRGTRSPALDVLARAPLWAEGLDYGHGTGHGVGYFLNVHEGPHGISQTLPNEPHTALEPGMVTSNEPGLYRPGRWGIRIENLIATVPAKSTPFGDFLRFETLTLCPIDTRLVDRSLLSAAEADWLNAYHATVRERLQPHVQGAARDWLMQRTEAI
ncbi:MULTISPECIES: aminopeptidase P family protein [Corallococcus]|uniref:aminopeptidase P family protein n=1 Tax=Corallococcus TaxID=83461 RepID=UPI00117D558E|nr:MULTISPECIES: aminopeptidase P family protein [Corallococcus]NBD08893.1 M24 family metallopeptidase [Corallococcus silvisoli]TSC32839.1 aminopeptidase P family protein [Corallococcus sp. Z5C101001]